MRNLAENDGGGGHKYVLGRLAQSGAELAIVMGPADDTQPGHHWLGAVLAIRGPRTGIPSLSEALRDNLFFPGCNRYLAAFDPKKVSAPLVAAARVRTQRAMTIMKAHARGEHVELPAANREEATRNRDLAKESKERAKTYAMNTRLKFERVYGAARRAIESGDMETARLKCTAALDLLRTEDIYGSRQTALIRTLEQQVRRLHVGLEGHVR